MTKLRLYPTLPSDEKLEMVDRGELWPRSCCAFSGCGWHAVDGGEKQLKDHIHAEHAADLAPIAEHMVRGKAEDAWMSIYHEAIAVKCRNQAPIAGSSLDRKALKSFAESKAEALVCFACAGVYSHVEEMAGEGKGDIEWVKPWQPNLGETEDLLIFLGRPVDDVGGLLSLKTFLERYDKVHEQGPRLQDSEDFGDWCLVWPSNVEAAGRKILCCPEDSLVCPVQLFTNRRAFLS